jgi:hypothetical protein
MAAQLHNKAGFLKAVFLSRSKLTHASRFKKERKPNKIEVNGNFYFPALLNTFTP